MSTLYHPVWYLENKDINSNGELVVFPDKNVVVMLQTSWCPHCTNAKPAFQQFAEQYQDQIICATIQADGDTEDEKKLGKRIDQIVPDFQGFPDYCLFVNGKRDGSRKIESRDLQGLVAFANL